ncbi:MAG: [LysW]-aminoadipate/[LysW]-glutamate kinase [Candidatus Bathyarchaeia archaeon]
MIVIKLGGSVLEESMPDPFIEDLRGILTEHTMILVHGGRKIVNEVSRRMGKEPQFIVNPKGFRSRYTDKETMDIFTMTMAGKINKALVSSLIKHGINAVGLSGIDGSLALAERKRELIVQDERGRRRIIDGGYTGKINRINTQLLRLLTEGGFVPVVSPIALGDQFELLNVDGDRMAAYIAGAMKADSLLLLTDVEGLLLEGKPIPRLSRRELEAVQPKIGHGMITKIYAAQEALGMGVREVIITSGKREKAVSSALNHQAGTLIVDEK